FEPLLSRIGDETFILGLLARELARATDGFAFPPRRFFRRLLIKSSALHLPEDALPLHLLLQCFERLIDIVVANIDLQFAAPDSSDVTAPIGLSRCPANRHAVSAFALMRHSWKPVSLMASSILSRGRRCGGALPGATAPKACHGRNRSGSLTPDGSSENARNSSSASDLKMYMRMPF